MHAHHSFGILAWLARRRVRKCRGFRIVQLWCVACAATLALALTGLAAPTPTESQVKAVFLYNFAQFVEWPPNSFTNETSPIVIGILGDDPFGSVLDQIVRGETVRGRKIVVKRLAPGDEFRSCHILFISHSEKERAWEFLQDLKNSPVLTVGEDENFCERGGMINFVRQDKNIRLEANRTAAEETGIKISSRLLSLARQVKTQRSKDRTQL